MVQVFGNRIIGGIGAPGGGMSEAFGAGVNTALNQKTSRQAMAAEAQRMRMLEQQFAWQGEDREEAKRRAAASAAAGAAARARSARIAEERMRIMGGAGGAPAAATLKGGGGGASAVTAPPPGLKVPSAGPLTFGSTVGPVASAAPGTVLDANGQPMSLTDIRFVRGETGATPPEAMRTYAEDDGSLYLGAPSRAAAAEYIRNQAARPGAYQARANQERLDASRVAGMPPSAAEIELGMAAGALGSENVPRMLDYRAELQQRIVDEVQARQEGGFRLPWQGEDLEELQAELQRVDAAIEVARVTPPSSQDVRGVTALEGPESTGGGVAPAARRAATEATITLPDGSEVVVPVLPAPTTVTDESGRTVDVMPGSPNAVQQEQLSFGPRLGATGTTTEEIALDNFLTQTGIDPYAPGPPRMGEPGMPDKAVATLLTQREQQLQLIELYTREGMYAEAEAVFLDVANTDTKLEAAAARLALQEIALFNAPQRLGAVWSGLTGREYEFRPSAGGGLDVYISGELVGSGIPMDAVREDTLMLADQSYAARQAELVTMQEDARAKGMGTAEANVYEYSGKAQIDLQKALAVGLTQLDLDALRRDLGLTGAEQLDFQKDENTGIVLVFRDGEAAAQYAPVESVGPSGEPIVRYELMQ